MNLDHAILPWNGTRVRVDRGLHDFLSGRLPSWAGRYLPSQITLAVDEEVTDDQISSFLAGMVRYLSDELSHRRRRCARIVERSLMGSSELESFLTEHRTSQPWILYFSKSGGLGDYDSQGYTKRSPNGLTPCFHLRNHGVAWQLNATGRYDMWLATARKPGLDWDWDSDIGHESCHSAFSPVPLFSLPAEEIDDAGRLDARVSASELNHEQLANICYMCSELAVVTVRGERRDTATGLPALEGEKYFDGFLALAHQLMPRFGFDRALEVFEALGRRVDPDRDEQIYEIGVPAIRAIDMLRPELNQFAVPSPAWFAQSEALAVGAV